jgi:N-acetyl-anhydromuramyl-L-alanine amidase AmpD
MLRIAPSPNHSPRSPAHSITCVVWHATASATLRSTLGWLTNPASQVSAHYLIDRDGNAWLLVPEDRAAWHAGMSAWRGLEVTTGGVPSLNPVSIGIELVNRNDGADRYPAAQLRSALYLTAWICARHQIDPANVIGHYECAVPAGRKTDPRGLDMTAIRAQVTALVQAR